MNDIVDGFVQAVQLIITPDCGFPLRVIVTRRSIKDLGIQPGEEIQACFKASAVHVTKS